MADKYGTGQDAQYCYPGSHVLINKLGLTDEAALEVAEIKLTQTRIDQYEPDFDNISLPALRAIHRHLFQESLGAYPTCRMGRCQHRRL